jgi:hypothetical protein
MLHEETAKVKLVRLGVKDYVILFILSPYSFNFDESKVRDTPVPGTPISI